MAYRAMNVLEASPADLAADMSYHRRTYARFLKGARWAALGSAAFFLVVFIIIY